MVQTSLWDICSPQLSFLQKMSLSPVENMPLSHSGPRGAQRSFWKRWLLSSAVLLLLCSISTLVLTFLPLKQPAKESCVAKFGPSPAGWQMTSPGPPCMNEASDWKLEILQNGLYLIYGQVALDATYKGYAPFDVRLRKNEDVIQTLTNNSHIQTVGGTYELHAGDMVDLIFNSEDQVLKNKTYWGIVLVANLHFTS